LEMVTSFGPVLAQVAVLFETQILESQRPARSPKSPWRLSRAVIAANDLDRQPGERNSKVVESQLADLRP